MTTANQRTGQDITVDTARLEQWYWGGLSGAERAEVRRLVVEEPAWREAYRAEVARKARVVPCRFGRDELDADRWRSAEERGRPVFTLPLPHTGDLAQLAVYVGAGQSHWYWLDGDSEREAHRDLASTEAVEWGDALLGTVRSTPQPGRLDALGDTLHAVDHLAAFLADRDALDPVVARSLARELREGELQRQLASGAAAFQRSDEDIEEQKYWAALALEGRMLLGAAAHRSDDDELMDLLCEADDALWQFRHALCLIDDETASRLTAGGAVDPESWEGAHMALRSMSWTDFVEAEEPDEGAEVIYLEDRNRVVAPPIPAGEIKQRYAADDEQTLAGLYEAPGWHQLRDDASWGAWILYQSQTDGSLKVYLRLRVEAEDADPAELQWSPDGEELIQHLNRGNGREFMFRIWPATFSFSCVGLPLEIVVREPGDGAS
jgi:hypothetical protein